MFGPRCSLSEGNDMQTAQWRIQPRGSAGELDHLCGGSRTGIGGLKFGKSLGECLGKRFCTCASHVKGFSHW